MPVHHPLATPGSRISRAVSNPSMANRPSPGARRRFWPNHYQAAARHSALNDLRILAGWLAG